MLPIVLIIFVTKSEKLGTKDQTRIARCTVTVFLSLPISRSSLECLSFIASSDLKRPGSYFILLPSSGLFSGAGWYQVFQQWFSVCFLI